MGWTKAGPGRYTYEVRHRGESTIAGRLFVARPDGHRDSPPPWMAHRWLRVRSPVHRFLVITAALAFLTASSQPIRAGAATGQEAGRAVLQRLLPDSGALFGAFPSDPTSPNRATRMAEFEAMVGRALDVERVYHSWFDVFPDAFDYWSRDQGHTLLLSWGAGVKDGPPVQWADIAAGDYDHLIDARAKDLKAFGSPTIFVFHHEPGLQDPSGTPEDYVAAYRHIHDRFDADGVTNLSFGIALLASQYDVGVADRFYPGDRYVDIIGVDGYNWYGCGLNHGNLDWVSFAGTFQSFHDFGASHGKPMMIAEWATGEDPLSPKRKANWISAAAATLKTWPDVKVVSWFDATDFNLTCNWAVDSSANSLAAFQAMGADPYFNPPTPPPPSTGVSAYVMAQDFFFSPAAGFPAQGLPIEWLFAGPSAHTVTDSSGMGLFDSGRRNAGATWSFPFVGAGEYPYRCSIHSQMTGSIDVPELAAPPAGTSRTRFTITWASRKAPAGYVYDVQIERPGDLWWKTWMTDQTVASTTFVPDGGIGVYSFRSRLRRISNGAASAYSQAAIIAVS